MANISTLTWKTSEKWEEYLADYEFVTQVIPEDDSEDTEDLRILVSGKINDMVLIDLLILEDKVTSISIELNCETEKEEENPTDESVKEDIEYYSRFNFM